MSPSRRGTSQLAARIATAALFLALAAAMSPFVPSVTAADPTADPGASPTAGPTADPAASPDPTASPEPTATPDPTASPDPGPTPSPEPAPAPSPSDPPATASPSSPPVEPPIDLLETPGPDPTPGVIGPLTLGPTGLVEGASPFSPHLVDSLTADGCAYCHRASTANMGGLTVAPYRDEALKPAGEAFQATDFGLCFLCHTTAPFTTSGTGETAFDLHALHLAEVDDPGGGGLDIDVAGDGQGNAICAECHFQLHQTAPQVDQQLVGFAPNVVPNGGVLEWTGTVGRSCTLTCHGHAHAAAGY
jgi:hypothetical protein